MIQDFKPEVIDVLHKTYQLIYQSGKLRADIIQEIRETMPQIPEVQYILRFLEESKRGIIS